ncbi:hypothetical protein F4778DRAFT_726260 [Xylariomycetidae sp. FL2044]|nr:hypothetical protein F4778DRAFT_726260 [Xylariomycetidae sp. FL2044]
MPMIVSPLTEPDIPGVVSAIQEAFAEDPYNNWVFNTSHVSRLLRCLLVSSFPGYT